VRPKVITTSPEGKAKTTPCLILVQCGGAEAPGFTGRIFGQAPEKLQKLGFAVVASRSACYGKAVERSWNSHCAQTCIIPRSHCYAKMPIAGMIEAMPSRPSIALLVIASLGITAWRDAIAADARRNGHALSVKHNNSVGLACPSYALGMDNRCYISRLP